MDANRTKLLGDFCFSTFEATWTAYTPLFLPAYAGSTMRGAFGRAFRRIACTMRQNTCEGCLLKRHCAYSFIFETKKADGITEDVRPFVLEPPSGTPRKFVPKETFTTRLVLFGQAIDYIPYFIVSFRELGDRGLGPGRGKCELSELSTVNPITDERTLVYRDSDKRIFDTSFPLTAADIIETVPILKTNRLAINFLTYTRLKHRNHFTDRVEFPILVTRLLDRIESLSGSSKRQKHTWLNGKTALDLINQAKEVQIVSHSARWREWSRYSARQDTRLKMGGVKGDVIYKGEITPFLPLLTIGQYTHVGKGTVFGLGKFEIRPALKNEESLPDG